MYLTQNFTYGLLSVFFLFIVEIQPSFAQPIAEVTKKVVQTITTAPDVDPKADAIVGSWSFYKNEMSVQIFKIGSEYQGRIIWLKQPLDKNGLPLLDKKNPEKVFRAQPIVNMVNLYGFRYNADDNMWEDGYIYNPLTGDTIKGSLELMDNNHLEMTGFTGFSLALTTETWTRM